MTMKKGPMGGSPGAGPGMAGGPNGPPGAPARAGAAGGGPAAAPGREQPRDGLLADLPVALCVELGRLEMGADEALALRTGQVVVFDKAPGDPVDLVVNGRLVGQGELVQQHQPGAPDGAGR